MKRGLCVRAKGVLEAAEKISTLISFTAESKMNKYRTADETKGKKKNVIL